jgi:hypothetical protein
MFEIQKNPYSPLFSGGTFSLLYYPNFAIRAIAIIIDVIKGTIIINMQCVY